MRILQINSATHFGGGERHFVDLSSRLVSRGHEIFLAIRTDCRWRDRLSFSGQSKIATLPLRNSLDIFSAKKLAKLIRREKIEIVHAHLARDYAIASLAIRLAPQAKLVLTRHVLFPVKRAQRFLLTNVSKVIAVSDAVAETLTGIFPSDKVTVIYNGLSIEETSEAERKQLREEFRFEENIPFDSPVLGTLGELKELKGQEDFLLAAQIVAKEFPDAHFIIVGEDNTLDKSFRRDLKRLAKVFDLESRFHWFDWMKDTRPFYSSIDVFASPSHSESFGLAILEAMANGCAVAATETEGAKLLLDNGAFGRLVPIANAAQLAAGICDLLRDENLRQEFARKAEEFARTKFSLEKMTDQTEAIYREVLL